MDDVRQTSREQYSDLGCIQQAGNYLELSQSDTEHQDKGVLVDGDPSVNGSECWMMRKEGFGCRNALTLKNTQNLMTTVHSKLEWETERR
jgi:hypothetical protein